MTTLRELLKTNQFRIVPFKDEKSRYLKPYKNTPFIKYKDMMNQRVGLVNTSVDETSKGLYLRNEKLTVSERTLTSKNTSVVLLDDETPVPNELKAGASRARFMPITLNQETLDTTVATITEVSDLLKPKSFAGLASLLISGEKLPRKDLLSVMSDPRALIIFETQDFVGLVSDPVMYEYATQTTKRVKLLRMEREQHVVEPESLALFTLAEQQVLKKAGELV